VCLGQVTKYLGNPASELCHINSSHHSHVTAGNRLPQSKLNSALHIPLVSDIMEKILKVLALIMVGRVNHFIHQIHQLAI
jgi:hypothetical protein